MSFRSPLRLRGFCRLHPILEAYRLVASQLARSHKGVAEEHSIQLEGTSLFYYEAYEMEFDGERWELWSPEPSFPTNIVLPAVKRQEGFDVVNFTARNSPECVGLSCSILAAQLRTNSHSLFDSFDEALRT